MKSKEAASHYSAFNQGVIFFVLKARQMTIPSSSYVNDIKP